MSLATLEVGVGWLKNFGTLQTDAQLGITQDDLDKAEVYAERKINADLGRFYDVSTSAFQAAPMVVEIAEMIGAARVLDYKFSREGLASPPLSGYLEDKAEQLMAMVAKSGLMDASGGLIAREVASVPRIKNIGDS